MNSLSPSQIEFSKKLTKLIEINLTNHEFGVSRLARELGMSRSNLHRKVKSVAKISVSQFINHVRLNFAMRMLCHGNSSCSQVAYSVGFGSVTYFNKCFHDYFGFPPGEAAKRDLIENRLIDELPQTKKTMENKKSLFSIATLFILIVFSQSIIIYFVFNPFLMSQSKKKKSIAVLPITDYTPEEGQDYILNGLRDDLISKLKIIKDLNVISRITSDKFRNTNKTIKEISKILKVDYILEGSGEKLNDKIKIQLQLIETATDKNLWSKPYVREITDDNILDFQDEVALLVANEINAFVTEKEKEQITNTETKNIAAYNFFLQGKNFMEIHEFTEYTNQELENKYFNYLELAQSNFQKAIQLDSTYSQAYVFMGWYYHYKSNIYIFDADKSDNYLDSALLMANKAIILHPHHADGYDLQSCIFAKKGMIKQSKKSSDKLISIDQNNWKAYYRVAENYYAMNLYSRAIRYFLMARNLNEEPLEDIRILRCLNACMIQSGFNKEAEPFLELLLNQENDSVEYYNNLSHKELSIGNADQALIYQLKAYALDTTKSQRLLQLSIINMTSKNENGMFHYFKKYLFKIQQDNLTMEPNKYAGYIYLVLGNKKESEYHFNQVLKNDIRRIELGTCNDYSYSSEYEIACIYSVKGEINKALDYLQLYKKKKSCPIWLITSLKTNPMLDNIRETSEFKKVLKDLEDKFQDEHNTTKRILINEGILQS